MNRCLATLSLVVCVVAFPEAQASDTTMTVHYFETGQALSALVEFSCGTMLIDAGAQDDRNKKLLIDSLKEFFAEHPERKNTLDLVLITHNHIDHTSALDAVRQNFKIKRLIEHGIQNDKGYPPIQRFKNLVKAQKLDAIVRTIKDSEITSLTNRTGLTDAVIDPFDCDGTNPRVRILSGRMMARPEGWNNADWENPNNHSLVTRIDFGQASFMFMGDAETALYMTLVDYYSKGSLMDADVLQIGHHGAVNGTSPEMLAAISPQIAIIPVGHWNWGMHLASPYVTWKYGHPRMEILDALAGVMTRERGEPIQIYAGLGARHYKKAWVSKAIYATDWDGNIAVTAKAEGTYVVRRSHID